MKFDSEIKEIFESSAKTIAKILLGIDIIKIKTLPTEVQEKLIADFVGEIETPQGKFLLHIEFQSSNDDFMPQRMLNYAISLYRKYLKKHPQKQSLPPIQILVYIGQDKLRMKNFFSLKTEFTETFHRFEIIDLSQIDAEKFLESDDPDVFILSILGKTQNRIEVIRKITEKLKKLNLDESKLLKYIYRIDILSELRSVEKEALESMPVELKIDVTRLLGYKQGKKEGKEEGIKEGIERGLREGLYTAIALDLQIKFGKKALSLMSKIRKISDIQKLKKLKKEIIKAKNLNEFSKKIYHANSNNKLTNNNKPY